MLKLAQESPKLTAVSGSEAIEDHAHLLKAFIRSHKVRGLAASTIKKDEHFIRGWFESHGPEYRPLYTWEAMNYTSGRQILSGYIDVLLESEIQTHTIRAYLGALRRYFSFVLEHPLIPGSGDQWVRIQEKYGINLAQPVSEFDMPRYVYDGERQGIPLEPEKLYDFYAVLRENYLTKGFRPVRERDYVMAVLAGETGLRVDELLHLDVDADLWFDSKKLQTRHAKAAKGSGKRTRITLFPPLARDTVRFYLKSAHPKLTSQTKSRFLFPSKTGQPLAYQNAQMRLKEMVKIARQNNINVANHMSWHWFRRFFATRFIERFPDKLAVLIELLGHMSPNTVHRYIRHSEAWMDHQVQEALEGVEKWLSTGT